MASTHILAVGKIVEGEMHYDISPLPVEEEVTAGELQRLIWEAEEAEDYEWDIEDRAIWRRGGW